MQDCLLDIIPLSSLTGIGVTQISKLMKIGLNTVQDILLHLPLRYEDRTHFCAIKDVLIGVYITVAGKVINCSIIFDKRQMMVCQISDGTGILTLRFFNFSKSMENSLMSGRHVIVYGKTKYGKYGVEIIHPKYCIHNDLNTFKLQKTLTPIYPTTEGIKQATLRKIIDKALDLLRSYTIVELLPTKLIQGMMSLQEALCTIHHPLPTLQLAELKNGQHAAQQRLIFEELLAHKLSMLALRDGMKHQRAQSIPVCNELKDKLLTLLPFKLTDAQARVVAEIERDMELDVPMMRLVQGDVGSGKTLVAILVALRAIANGKKVALMAPTELLVEQHTNNFRNLLTPLGIKVGSLVGKQKGKERLIQQNAITSGKIQIIVGTHALFQEQIQFNCNLALVIIDEQHRFGVHQRLALLEKGLQQGFHPHQLIMTATPIPRTLEMTSYANLDTSTIDELPPGRTPITTIAIPDTRRRNIIDRLRNAFTKGQQAYWVCTLIEESEILKAQAAKATWKKLQLALPEVRVGLLHGRMGLIEKQAIMQSFKQRELHLLVTTTVIEVGMDVPNASLMIIENPERLGLAQLHQLRGRVGRGSIASYCVLLYKSPLSKMARKRLQVLRHSNDGFIIAQKDLEIRGPGELLGTRQTGNIKFKVANLLRDQALLPEVQRIARYMHEYFPDQAVLLINRWISKTKRYSNA